MRPNLHIVAAKNIGKQNWLNSKSVSPSREDLVAGQNILHRSSTTQNDDAFELLPIDSMLLHRTGILVQINDVAFSCTEIRTEISTVSKQIYQNLVCWLMHERTGAIARSLLLVSQPQVVPVAMKLWLEITNNPSKEIAKTQNVTTLIHNFLLRKSNLLDQQEATVTLPVPCLQRFRRRFHPLPLKGSAFPWWFANTIQLETDRKKSTKSNLEAFY